MSEIQLGNEVTIPWRRSPFVVCEIKESDSFLTAADYSDNWNLAERARLTNTLFANVDIEEYIPGDLIRRREKLLRLEAEEDVFFLYEYIIIRRIANAGSTPDFIEHEGDGEPSEGGGERGESREGLGE